MCLHDDDNSSSQLTNEHSPHERINPEPQEESFRYIIANSGRSQDGNIVFMAHLGDMTEDAAASSFSHVDQAFDIMDTHGEGQNHRDFSA